MTWLETFLMGTDGVVLGPFAILFLSLLLRMVAERRARRRSDRQVSNLRRYVAPALADQVAAQARPDFAVGASRRQSCSSTSPGSPTFRIGSGRPQRPSCCAPFTAPWGPQYTPKAAS